MVLSCIILETTISIHAPRVGGDFRLHTSPFLMGIFQSTPPVWGATLPTLRSGALGLHFNPRPPCGGRLSRRLPRIIDKVISIHAPRVGGDGRYTTSSWSTPISIHAPRVGGDRSRGNRRQSGLYFNPRPPCGGRLATQWRRFFCIVFQSTPPVWGATYSGFYTTFAPEISIHAPRVGGDL